QRQKDHQARLRPKALHHKPDEIIGDVAGCHEADVVEHKLHDALQGTGIAPAPVLITGRSEQKSFSRKRREVRSQPATASRSTSRRRAATPRTSGSPPWRPRRTA